MRVHPQTGTYACKNCARKGLVKMRIRLPLCSISALPTFSHTPNISLFQSATLPRLPFCCQQRPHHLTFSITIQQQYIFYRLPSLPTCTFLPKRRHPVHDPSYSLPPAAVPLPGRVVSAIRFSSFHCAISTGSELPCAQRQTAPAEIGISFLVRFQSKDCINADTHRRRNPRIPG